MLYVINGKGHWFKVADDVALDRSRLNECEVFEHEEAFWARVRHDTGLDADELDGSAWEIRHSSEGDLVSIDIRGIAAPIDTSAETYLNDFVL